MRRLAYVNGVVFANASRYSTDNGSTWLSTNFGNQLGGGKIWYSNYHKRLFSYGHISSGPDSNLVFYLNDGLDFLVEANWQSITLTADQQPALSDTYIEEDKNNGKIYIIFNHNHASYDFKNLLTSEDGGLTWVMNPVIGPFGGTDVTLSGQHLFSLETQYLS